MHAFIEANVAYTELDSANLIHDTFEEEAVRFESDTVSILIFVMVINLWLTMACHKNLRIICTPLFGDVVLWYQSIKVHECHSYSGMQLFRMISPCSSEIRRDQEVGGKRGTSDIQLCTM